MNQKIKISQLPAKGSNLAAADLLEIAEFTGTGYISKSITGQELIDAIPATVVEWGDIGGTLSTQTDLQSALNAKVPTSRTLTINGTTQDLSADRTFTVATGITIGTTAITSGVVGRVLFEGAGNVVQESGNLFWDNVNGRLGIGTSLPTQRLHLLSAANSGNFARVQNTNGGATAAAGYEMQSNTAYGSLFANSSAYVPYGVLAASQIGFYTNNTFAIAIDSATADFRIGIGTAPTEKFRITNGGNVLINTTTDAGFTLDVNGTARVKTDLKIETATGGLTIEGDAGGFPTLKINTLRSGATRRNWMFATEQFAAGDFVLYRSTTGGGIANTPVYSIFNTGNFAINTTTDAGFRLDVNGTARVQGQTTMLTNVAGNFLALLVSNTNSGNTSRSTLSFQNDAGDVGSIGAFSSTFASSADDAANAMRILAPASGGLTLRASNASGNIRLYTQSTERMRIFSTGNIGINTTTDAGFRLDVNGTARVSGVTSVITASQRISFNLSQGVYIGQGVNNNAIGSNNSNRLFIGSEGDMAIYTLNNGTFIISDIANPASSASAKFRVDSTTQGFLPPRMTTTQKNAIASPAAGLMVYDTTLNLISVYNGTTWITL